MRTTLDIPEKVLSEVVHISGNKKSEAVRVALEEYIREHALKRLLSLPGKIDIEVVSRELEQLELGRMTKFE
ncbi:MAG: type II toxin-antitoxin system VapB family antitoxin [Chloroflexi bacterium]|nr:type II toxin-antitoxin system VapB family antitoxin [Chloroflexota bacterium]